MPTYERRFFIGLKTKDNKRKEMEAEKERELIRSSGSRKKNSVSGDALKNKIKSGEIPNK
jgi:hypothetical protein